MKIHAPTLQVVELLGNPAERVFVQADGHGGVEVEGHSAVLALRVA